MSSTYLNEDHFLVDASKQAFVQEFDHSGETARDYTVSSKG